MGLFKLIELLIILILISTNYCYTLSAANKKWYPRDITSNQDLRSLLDNVYDNLRRVESIEFRLDRFDTLLSRMSNKIDSFGSLLNAVQNSLSYRMNQLYEIGLKYDMHKEEMIQKYETSQTRLLLGISKLEARLGDAFNKIQGNPDVNLLKIENKQNDVINKVTEINSSLDAIKSNSIKLEGKINNTQNDFMHHFKNSQQQLAKKDHLDKIENKINGLHSRLNKTEVMWTQNDSPNSTNLEQHMVNDIKYELRIEGQKIGNKVNNMYNEMERKLSSLENSIEKHLHNCTISTNKTQKNMEDYLHSIDLELGAFAYVVADNLSIMITDLQHRVENNFQTSLTYQKHVIRTYERIKEITDGYGSRIEFALTKLVDRLDNKTDSLSRENTDLLEAIKGHNSQMIRSVSDAKNMVITLAEENSQDHKTLDNSILEVGKRADIVAATIEEVQDQLGDINGTLFSNSHYFTITPNSYNTNPPGPEDDTSTSNSTTKTVHAVEANYGNGVIKIITDDLIPRLDKRESAKELNENLTVINLNMNSSNKDSIENLLYLNNALSTSKITGIISSSNNNKLNVTSNVTINSDTNKDDNDSTKKLEVTSIEDEDIETSLILSYINFIKGRITKDEFLQEGYPGKSFKSIKEMISYMKPLKNVRNEFLKELDKYDQEEMELDNITSFFDPTNLEYEDSSDEMI